MSYRLVTAAWSVPLSASAKLVLVRLCDFADEDGVCWPGLPRLAADTGLCERAVRNAISAIEKAGMLTKKRGGPRGTTYRVKPAPDAAIEPPIPAPGSGLAPPEDDEYRHLVPPIPAPRAEKPASGSKIPAPGATKLSRTKNEPAKEPVRRATKGGAGSISIPPWVPPEAWNDFVENRVAIGHPLTPVAAKQIFNRLDGFRQAGIDVAERLNDSTMNGYRGVFAPKGGVNGHAHGQPKMNSAQRAFAEFAADLDRMEQEKTDGH